MGPEALSAAMSADNNLSAEAALDDVDGDRDLHVVFANSGLRNKVCLGDGTGAFTCGDVSTDTNSTGPADVSCPSGKPARTPLAGHWY